LLNFNSKSFELLDVVTGADRVHMSLSADLRWLAFCLDGTSEEYSEGVSMAVQGNKQYVCEIGTGKLIQVAPQAKSSWAGVWSPDGTELAFFADIDGAARLWIWSSSDHSLKLASDTKARPFFGFEKPIWTRDGKGIMIKAMPEDDVEDQHFYSSSFDELAVPPQYPVILSTQSPASITEGDDNLTWEDRYRADLVLIDRMTGDTRPLCIGQRPVGISLSPDGRKVAFASFEGNEVISSQQNSFHLWVCEVGDHPSPLCIAQDVRFDYGVSFSWGPDNDTLYYTTSGPLSDGGLWSVKLSSPHVTQRIGKPEGVHLGREYDAPMQMKNGQIITVAGGKLWIFDPSTHDFKTLEWDRRIEAMFPLSPSDDMIIVQTREMEERLDGFWRINLNTLHPEIIFEERYRHYPWSEGGAAYAHHEGAEVIAYIAQNADHPPSLRIMNGRSDKQWVLPLSNIREELLGTTTHLLSWTSKHRHVQGALLLPKDVSGRVPVIMRVYGGSMQGYHFYRSFGLSDSAADNHHMFASHGYAVFLPDLPMDRTHEPLDEVVTTIKDALEALKQHPNIDPDRIGIIGHSFGGYSTLAAVTRIPELKAAVVSAGIGSLISMYTNYDPFLDRLGFGYGWVEDGQANLGDSLWGARERYIRNSPLFDFDKIEAPVLILQGVRDHVCRHEAAPIYAALNRLGKVAQLVLYDEDHWPGAWKRENLEDYYRRILEWYGKYL